MAQSRASHGNKTKLQFSSVASLPRPEELCTVAPVPFARLSLSALLATLDSRLDRVDLNSVLLAKSLHPSLIVSRRSNAYCNVRYCTGRIDTMRDLPRPSPISEMVCSIGSRVDRRTISLRSNSSPSRLKESYRPPR
jgi:hypothetical protein